jgi:hypothetical protein
MLSAPVLRDPRRGMGVGAQEGDCTISCERNGHTAKQETHSSALTLYHTGGTLKRPERGPLVSSLHRPSHRLLPPVLQLFGPGSTDAPVSRSTTGPEIIAVKRTVRRGGDEPRSRRDSLRNCACPLTAFML